MFSPFLLLAFLSLLAGRVLAFNITVGNKILNPAQILAIPDSPVKTACSADCNVAQSKLTACNDDATCLCNADTVSSLLTCETCMFHFLIATNKPAPDFRAGSNPVLVAYSTSCLSEGKITLTAEQTALILPNNWNGPFVAILPVGGAAVTVVVGSLLGIGLILILSNLS
ncbi:hypothetical protein B0H34DRAFT_720131 [Crassisporium funariophilum]|nr:hypothetical protein B0H34DRAFT_720131 [Crassisporium funariophilum]